MWPVLFSLLSPAGRRGKLSIVVYHRVREAPDPLFPAAMHAAQFEHQLAWLANAFTVLPLSEAAARLASGSLPARALCVTFDDGYADNLTVAAPILARHRMPATVFVVSGCLDGGCMWNDAVIQALRHCSKPVLDLSWSDLGTLPLGSLANRREAIRRTLSHLKYLPPGEREQRTRRLLEQADVPGLAGLMLSTMQLKSLRAHDISVGAHTVTHPILTALDSAQAQREIAQSKADLEAITGEAVELFAYPNGRPGVDYDAGHVEMVRRAGFKAAVSTAWGVGRRATDVYQLPRFNSWGATTLVRGLRFAQNLRRVSAAA